MIEMVLEQLQISLEYQISQNESSITRQDGTMILLMDIELERLSNELKNVLKAIEEYRVMSAKVIKLEVELECMSGEFKR